MYGIRSIQFSFERAVIQQPIQCPTDPSEQSRLVRKAENAAPFVEAITHCVVVERQPQRLIREVMLHGETLRELILFYPRECVEFVRLSGHAKGQIKNIIEEDQKGGFIPARFTFDLVLEGVEPGSAQESEFAVGMEAAYLDAVHTTLRRIRQEAVEPE